MIYLDHNATTPLLPEVLEAMSTVLKDSWGNPSSAHRFGQQARKAVEESRGHVAALIGCTPDELVFTSCGSEANALALFGTAHARFEESQGKLNHILTSKIEHDSILEAVEVLRRRGFTVELVGADSQGRIDPKEVAAKLKPETALVSLQLANNEVGTLQPVKEIAALCRAKNIPFHTDAVQAVGKIPVDVKDLGVDLLSLSAHKFYGPKGMGALFVRRGHKMQPLVAGNQEKNRRGGTLNAAGIVGLGTAAKLAKERMTENSKRLLALRGKLEQAVLGAVKGAKLNGHPTDRLPNTAHFSFEGLEGHQLLIALDLEGVCVSAGPACSSGAAEPSHVLLAMGCSDELASGCIRFSLGAANTEADIDALVKILPNAVAKLREVHSLI